MAHRRVTPHAPVAPLFADEFVQGPAYSNWRPDGSGDWLLIYTASGTGAIGLSDAVHETKEGDVILYEPDAHQDYSTAKGAGRWNLLWAHFLPRPAWQPWLQWPRIGPGIRLARIPVEERSAFREALLRMIRCKRRGDPLHLELAMNALEEAILRARAAQGGDPLAAADPRIARAVARLSDHFKEPFRLEALARHCGLSVSRFSHLFRAQLGLTPGQFLERQRLSHAVDLLRRTALGVAEVAAACGFDDPFYFSNRFRRLHGRSPSRFRRKIRDGADPGLRAPRR